jgi:hypothetical protein
MILYMALLSTNLLLTPISAKAMFNKVVLPHPWLPGHVRREIGVNFPA